MGKFYNTEAFPYHPMTAPPIRFEEVAYNYGFIPEDPLSSRSYCTVYRLFWESVSGPGKVVLVRGNELAIQLKDISGPMEDREKITIFSQDITDYYPFNFKSKAVGFLIEAKRRSKTGYWFIVFEREGQLAAFCAFLHWLIYGEVPRQGRSLSPYRPSASPTRYHNPRSRRRSGPRSQAIPVYSTRNGPRTSVLISCAPSNFGMQRSKSFTTTFTTTSSDYSRSEETERYRRSPSARRSRYH